jgi:hypothetical protein
MLHYDDGVVLHLLLLLLLLAMVALAVVDEPKAVSKPAERPCTHMPAATLEQAERQATLSSFFPWPLTLELLRCD